MSIARPPHITRTFAHSIYPEYDSNVPCLNRIDQSQSAHLCFRSVSQYVCSVNLSHPQSHDLHAPTSMVVFLYARKDDSADPDHQSTLVKTSSVGMLYVLIDADM